VGLRSSEVVRWAKPEPDPGPVGLPCTSLGSTKASRMVSLRVDPESQVAGTAADLAIITGLEHCLSLMPSLYQKQAERTEFGSSILADTVIATRKSYRLLSRAATAGYCSGRSWFIRTEGSGRADCACVLLPTVDYRTLPVLCNFLLSLCCDLYLCYELCSLGSHVSRPFGSGCLPYCAKVGRRLPFRCH
jgi:hypothetical protein